MSSIIVGEPGQQCTNGFTELTPSNASERGFRNYAHRASHSWYEIHLQWQNSMAENRWSTAHCQRESISQTTNLEEP